MARKPKPLPTSRPTALPKLPFSMCDRAAYINRPWVAVERAGKDFLYCIYYAFADSQVHCSVVAIADIDNYQEGHAGVKAFYVDGYHTGFGPTGLAKTHLGWLKIQALRGGATPDAIRFMASALKLTKKEQDNMAKKKAGEKPVANGGKLGKKGGNPEALAKAREAAAARTAANASKKLTVKVTDKQLKSDEFKLRGGRLAKLSHLISSKPKTVGDVLGTTVKDDTGKEHKIDMGALRGMEKRGHIAIG